MTLGGVIGRLYIRTSVRVSTLCWRLDAAWTANVRRQCASERKQRTVILLRILKVLKLLVQDNSLDVEGGRSGTNDPAFDLVSACVVSTAASTKDSLYLKQLIV